MCIRDRLKTLEAIDIAQDVVPSVRLNFDFVKDEFSQTVSGSGVSPGVLGLPERIIAGEMIGEEDLEQVLIHELLAYQMGFVTQKELDSLIGTEITTVFEPSEGNAELSSLLSSLESGDIGSVLDEQSELLSAIKSLVGDVDLSALTDEQKKLIRTSLKTMMEEAPSDSEPIERTFTIKGVYYSLGETDLFSLFKKLTFDTAQPVLFHYRTATQLQLGTQGQKTFYSATVYVDSFKDLEPLENEVEQLGYRTSSARDMLTEIDKRIDGIGQAIYFVALSVLVVTAIAISNALVVSVVERTQEFGIMKSLGARTKNIVSLMMFEGALLGAIGAGLAVGLSIAIGKLGQGFLRQYLEGRINQSVSGDLISFSPVSIATVVIGAIILCSLASIIPAWRAARLDPVVAMHKS